MAWPTQNVRRGALDALTGPVYTFEYGIPYSICRIRWSRRRDPSRPAPEPDRPGLCADPGGDLRPHASARPAHPAERAAPTSSACRVSRCRMRCTCCIARASSPRAVGAALKSPSSTPRASASSTRCAVRSMRWPPGSPLSAPQATRQDARGWMRRSPRDAVSIATRRSRS